MRFATACLSITALLAATGCERAETPPAPESGPPPAEAQVQPDAPTNGGVSFEIALTGAEEVPGPGDPDGTGSAKVTLDPGKGEVCYEINVANIDPANAAHIHSGAVGEAGPVVVPLDPPTQGTSKNCATVDAQVVATIQQNAANHYVNVHNPGFPAGAVRGQLQR